MEAVRVKPESWIQEIISYSAESMRVKTGEAYEAGCEAHYCRCACVCEIRYLLEWSVCARTEVR